MRARGPNSDGRDGRLGRRAGLRLSGHRLGKETRDVLGLGEDVVDGIPVELQRAFGARPDGPALRHAEAIEDPVELRNRDPELPKRLSQELGLGRRDGAIGAGDRDQELGHLLAAPGVEASREGALDGVEPGSPVHEERAEAIEPAALGRRHREGGLDLLRGDAIDLERIGAPVRESHREAEAKKARGGEVALAIDRTGTAAKSAARSPAA